MGDTGRMAVQGGMHTYGEAAERWLRERNVSLFLCDPRRKYFPAGRRHPDQSRRP